MSHDKTVGELFLKEIRLRLHEAHVRIQHCIGQLTDHQAWWRPQDSMNSIANILLHLSGNVRQWIINGVTRTQDHRNRPEEFSSRSITSRLDLLTRLNAAVCDADNVLAALSIDQLLEDRRIQGFDETVMSAILNSVSHFCGHAQEIVYITRLQLGSSYRFAWTPATLEQGA